MEGYKNGIVSDTSREFTAEDRQNLIHFVTQGVCKQPDACPSSPGGTYLCVDVDLDEYGFKRITIERIAM